MTDTPREYDREYTDDCAPYLRVRLGYSHDRGTVFWFVLQLEYHHRVDIGTPELRCSRRSEIVEGEVPPAASPVFSDVISQGVSSSGVAAGIRR